MKRLLSFPYAFVLMNWAAVPALYYFITGKKDIWLKNKSVHRHRY
jgi:hypothetical protein